MYRVMIVDDDKWVLTDISIKNIGGAPRFEHATSDQVLAQLAAKDMFDAIM